MRIARRLLLIVAVALASASCVGRSNDSTPPPSSPTSTTPGEIAPLDLDLVPEYGPMEELRHGPDGYSCTEGFGYVPLTLTGSVQYTGINIHVFVIGEEGSSVQVEYSGGINPIAALVANGNTPFLVPETDSAVPQPHKGVIRLQAKDLKEGGKFQDIFACMKRR